jgi:predicted transcriptional regulator
MTTTTKTNLMVPNKLTAFNRVKLIAMADAGVRHSAIARDLGITQQAVMYHVDRQKTLTDKYSTSTDDAPTITSQPPKGDTLVTKGYLVGSTYYGTFAEVASAVTIGDTVETITVTSTQVVGLVEQKEG